jgi:hypothetical protein
MDSNLRDLLRDVRRFGGEVEFFAMEDACPICRALRGKRFDPREAPTIPVPHCQNEACRCDYLPV